MPTLKQLEKERMTEIDVLRERRQSECFYYVDRGNLWWEQFTESQKTALTTWRDDWLEVTNTKVIPVKPNFL